MREWGDGRIPGQLRRVGHGGNREYVVITELARAIQSESAAATCHWLGVGTTTVSKWRRALGVRSFNDGTRKR